MKRYNVISGTALTGAGAEIYEDSEGRFVKYSDALAAIEQARKNEGDWKRAVDQLLTTWHTTADSYASPREAIKALIAFEVMTALDPNVSSDAAALVEQARREEREACASLCDSLRTVIIDGALVPAMPSHCAAAIRVRKP